LSDLARSLTQLTSDPAERAGMTVLLSHAARVPEIVHIEQTGRYTVKPGDRSDIDLYSSYLWPAMAMRRQACPIDGALQEEPA
jgi:hypothetical protein